MLEATFEQAYPIARRAVQVRATAAVVCGIIPVADREDFEQEGLTACWRALPHFNPARASLRTFVEHVIAARLASIIRSARRAPVLLPIESASTLRIAGDASCQELRADVMRLLDRLGPAERHLVQLLLDHSPAEASRILGVPRSTLHDQVVRLRRRFSLAGLGASGGAR
ncbi:MAG: sigma-70 family RNA polymerase sigma factor [Bryobacteraceae bacterium]